MNNPNPFLPKGSLLEQQSQRRSRLKIAVFCVLLVSVTGLVGMLIQGCKRNTGSELNPPPTLDPNNFAMDTNQAPLDATNPPDMMAGGPQPTVSSNPPPTVTPLPPVNPLPPIEPAVGAGATEVPAAGSEYVVAKGDSLAKIAKKHGVTLKALQDANPGVQPTKLKVGQKLVIPAGGKASAEVAAPGATAVTGESSSTTYTVKTGDTLSKIAKAHGVTIKALQTANHLTTTKISVGKKLKIPAKAAKTAPAPAPAAPVAPVAAPLPEPAPAPASAPALAPLPAPAAPVNH